MFGALILLFTSRQLFKYYKKISFMYNESTLNYPYIYI